MRRAPALRMPHGIGPLALAIAATIGCATPPRSDKGRAAAMTPAAPAQTTAPATTTATGQSMHLDAILERASGSQFIDYDPRHVIAAVNALVPLGRQGALDAMESFLARRDLDADPHQGLFLVLRVLFEAPSDPGHHPPMRIGGSFPPPPPSPLALPRFPIVLVDDVPLMLVSGYVLGGEPEPIAWHLGWYRDHGTIRSRPLAPAPGNLLAQVEAEYRRAYGTPPPPQVLDFLRSQIDRMR